MLLQQQEFQSNVLKAYGAGISEMRGIISLQPKCLPA